MTKGATGWALAFHSAAAGGRPIRIHPWSTPREAVRRCLRGSVLRLNQQPAAAAAS